MKNGYAGEMRSLGELGVTAIDLSNQAIAVENNFDGRGNQLMTQQGAVATVNGQQRSYADIWHQKT